jgi:hypothetical protein
VFIVRVTQRKMAPLIQALESELSKEQAEELLSMYGLSADSMMDDKTITILSQIAQDLRYLNPTDELASCWSRASRYHVSVTNPFEEADSCHRGLAHHSIDLMLIFRNYNDAFAQRGLRRHLDLSDVMGRAWLDYFHGKEMWKGQAQGISANFGEEGIKRVEVRDDVRLDHEQARRLAAWHQVGLYKVGRIANKWISEQNDRRPEENFVF